MTSRLVSLRAAAISYGAKRVLGVTLSDASAATLTNFGSVDRAIDRLELRVSGPSEGQGVGSDRGGVTVAAAVADAMAEAEVYGAGTMRVRKLMQHYFNADVVLTRLPDAVAARGTVPQLLDDLRQNGTHLWFFDEVERLYNTLLRKLTLAIASESVRRGHARELDGLFREHLALVAAAIGGS